MTKFLLILTYINYLHKFSSRHSIDFLCQFYVFEVKSSLKICFSTNANITGATGRMLEFFVIADQMAMY